MSRARAVMAVALVAASLLITAASTARAETRRIAVVVGSNRGNAAHAVLRYAEQDATKLAAVLGELGGLAPSDLLLLRGPSAGAVRGALDEAARRVSSWHAEGRGQVVLLFYFSGHSDGQVLELSDQSLPFAELRQKMTASGADVRLMIVDSCRSGALLAVKGGTLGQAFDIRLADDLASTGEALIASSAAEEAALESAEIGASFFSHHFISGLRGGADLSGDGLVTLAEAFQYAAARTLRATSDTLVGPQHAAYDYHLAGRGDLVLTELRRPSAVLDLPPDFDRLLLVASSRQETVAELGPRSARRIAVPAGAYEVRAWRGGRTFGARVTLGQGQERRVAAGDLLPVTVGMAAQKGGDGPEAVVVASPAPQAMPPAAKRNWGAAAAIGLTDGVARDSSLGTLRLGLERGRGPRRMTLTLMAGTAHTNGMRESRFGVEIAPSWWLGSHSLRLGLGMGAGVGFADERTDGGQIHWSGLAWASPLASAEGWLDARTALIAGASAPVTLLRRDNSLTLALLPSAWIGIATSF
jgi:hypothetical protein